VIDPRPVREYWVGRGDPMGHYALFLYMMQAHGIADSTAQTRAGVAKKRLREGAEPPWDLTVIAGVVGNGDDRNVVTSEQATADIQRVHAQILEKPWVHDVPAEARCLDPALAAVGLPGGDLGREQDLVETPILGARLPFLRLRGDPGLSVFWQRPVLD
jgi:hypothetical protein